MVNKKWLSHRKKNNGNGLLEFAGLKVENIE